MRTRREIITSAVLSAWPFVLASCAGTEAWQTGMLPLAKDLAELSIRAAGAGPGPVADLRPDAAPGIGDRVVLDIRLDDGERRSWELEIEVVAVRSYKAVQGRVVQAFEKRVQPSAERRRAIEAVDAEFQLAVGYSGHWEMEMGTMMPFASLRIAARDDRGGELGVADASELAERLGTGLLPACRAGHRQRELMRGRVEQGLAAPMLTLPDDAYDDVAAAGEGVAACERFFRMLRENPVTREILFEVLSLPSLWSMLTRGGVDVAISVDFFAAEAIGTASPGDPHELWAVPMALMLNDQPALLAHVLVGPAGSPHGTVAGIRAIVARNPDDPDRKVVVEIASSRRGPAAEPQ